MQASHGGETAAGVEAGGVTRERVTDIGRVLTGEAEHRRTGRDITLFGSSGPAIQNLAIAKRLRVVGSRRNELLRHEL